MIFTTELYYNGILVFILSNTGDDRTIHDAISQAVNTELQWWKVYFPSILKDIKAFSGYLTDASSKRPADNGVGEIFDCPAVVAAVLQSIQRSLRGVLRDAGDNVNKDLVNNKSVVTNPEADDVDGWEPANSQLISNNLKVQQ